MAKGTGLVLGCFAVAFGLIGFVKLCTMYPAISLPIIAVLFVWFAGWVWEQDTKGHF